MRKALVFVAAFALVLVAGAAVAFMGTPENNAADETPQALEKPTTTSSTFHEKEEPPAKEEPQVEEQKEEPPKEEDKKEEPPKEEKDEVKEEADTDPPDLVILHPEDGQRFEKKEVAYEGKTEPGARVFAGKYEAEVDAEGNWRIVLVLTHDGSNSTVIKASDEAGNEAEASVKVYYDPPKNEEKPKEEEPKEEPKEHDFSANQKYGSSLESPPWDKWYGTGTPGTEIWIGNDWGSSSTTIPESGEWYLKVQFPEMPCGTKAVVLETNDGDRNVFEFSHVCGEGGGGEEGDDK
jgi:hypothetical protein